MTAYTRPQQRMKEGEGCGLDSNGCDNEEEVEIIWTSSEEKWNGESIYRGKC